MVKSLRSVSVITGLLVCLLGGLAPSVRAVDILDDPIQIDEGLVQLVQASNSLAWEMYRYHQQQPDYQPAYRAVKELWKQAGALRESLQNGPIETATLQQQVLKFKEQFGRVQETMANWGDGDRSALAKAGAVRPRATVTEEGFAVDLPLLGLQLGGPRVTVVEEGPQVLQRIRLHPNSHGSRRRLQRELTAVKLALQYLLEDAEVEAAPEPPAPGNLTSGPVPHPPEADEAKLGQPVKIQPMGAK